jgi:hypothetical protein
MCDGMADDSAQCITRIIDGDQHDLHLAQLQFVMQRIQDALRDVPPAERLYLGNALLNLAVNRILCDEGSQRTASILLRLSGVVETSGKPPPAHQAVELTRLDG